MKIGVLADIHGHVDYLEKAIAELKREGVEKFVVLGDLIYDTTDAIETVDLLRGCHAEGVWGNHELGLCVDITDSLREMYSRPVVEYCSTLQPRFEMGDILFTHNLPDQDASDPVSYYLGPSPNDRDARATCFAQFPHQVMLMGHFHRWFAADHHASLDWQGETPLQLQPDRRYFCVIHAVKDGWAAVIDQDHGILKPIRL